MDFIGSQLKLKISFVLFSGLLLSTDFHLIFISNSKIFKVFSVEIKLKLHSCCSHFVGDLQYSDKFLVALETKVVATWSCLGSRVQACQPILHYVFILFLGWSIEGIHTGSLWTRP